MKLIFSILPFAVVTSAFVLPSMEVMEPVAIEKRPQSTLNRVDNPVGTDWSEIDTQAAIASVQKPLRFTVTKTKTKAKCHESASILDIPKFFPSSVTADENIDIDGSITRLHRPNEKQIGDDSLPTVYQLLSTTKNTQKFFKFIDKFPDLVDLLNGTAANYTVFAPIDAGVHDDPEDDTLPKKLVHKALSYHISPVQYNAYSVFFARTIGTVLEEEAPGGYAQRLRVGFGLGGLQLNFKSKFLSTDNFASNGILHLIDEFILPPPTVGDLISASPAQFSTFSLALLKSGFDKVLPDAHIGGTVFAPTNAAFAKLGPVVNAFLFSKAGEGLLKALVQYHIVANHTMHSDAYFMHDDGENGVGEARRGAPGPDFHVDLPTLLRKQSLSIDVKRWGRLIDVRVNGFLSVQVVDSVASDGVLHTMGDVLLPPKNPRREPRDGDGNREFEEFEEFKARFEGLGEDF